MKAIITIGCSGSGKSTYAKELIKVNKTLVELNRDSLRFKEQEINWNTYKFTSENEDKVTREFNILLNQYIKYKQDIIISDTNLNLKRLSSLEYNLKNNGYTVERKYFNVSFDELLKRNNQRKSGVPYEVLLNQYINYQRNYNNIKKYSPNFNKRKAYIVDIDGTLSEKCNRNIFDYSKVQYDLPLEHITTIISSLYDTTDYKIFFLTGRDDNCFNETLSWLRKNVYPFVISNDLIMRITGDKRKDSIVKMELFDKYIRNNYNVLAVFDDRKQVIEECWSVLGVNIINVGKLNERF